MNFKQRESGLLVPRYPDGMRVRDRVAPPAKVGARMEGRIHYQLVDREGKIVDEGESHNLVLDAGLDLVASHGLGQGIFAYCVVGTGSTAPAATDTGLVAELTRTNTTWQGDSTVRTSNGVYDISRYFEFTYGAANGNLTEFGFSPNSGTGANLFSRALFRDGGGSPKTITKTSSEKLRVNYTLTVTLTPVTSTVGSFTITNVTPAPLTGHYLLIQPGNTHIPRPDLGTFNWLATGAVAGNSGGYGTYASGPAIGGFSFDGNTHLSYGDTIWDHRFYQGSNGSATSGATGYSYMTGGSPPAYVAGSYQRGTYQQGVDTGLMNYTIYGFAINGGNWSDGSGAVEQTPGYIFAFDSGVSFAKDNLHTLTVGTPVVSWSR